MNKPKVSVLIPAYNHGKYLRETIESVLNQTFSDFELLISDDCSTDYTAQIIQSISDERVSGIFFDKNQGTVRSLNYLLSQAKGEYIAVLGSDDVWVEDKLEKQLNVLENNQEIAACFSWATIIDQNSREITDSSVFQLDIFNCKNQDRISMLKECFLTGNHLCHSSALIRSNVHDEVGKYNVVYRQLHDYDLWVRFLLKHKIYIIESELVKYRYVVNSGNVSQNTGKNITRLYNEAEEIVMFLIDNISDNDFVEAFGEFFVGQNVTTPTQIACEKYLLLQNMNFWGYQNSMLDLRFIFKTLNEEMLSCLEHEYGITLNGIYERTATPSSNCYTEHFHVLQEQCESYRQQVSEIYASTSWRMTKPLRFLSEKMKKK